MEQDIAISNSTQEKKQNIICNLKTQGGLGKMAEE